jgi:hypothetical protein
MARNAGSLRQLTGIVIPDDRFKAANPARRLSRLDPLLTYTGST